MRRLGPYAALVGIAAAWSLTLPLIRIAVSTGYRPLGLLLWQTLIMAGLLALLLGAMGRPAPRVRGNLALFAMVSVSGAVLPGVFVFLTAPALPAGVRAIVVALVPIFVLPMALALGFERADPWRALGVLLGAAAVATVSLPGGLPAGVVPGVLLLALISPLSYAVEASYLAWRGPHGLHPFEVLFGASLVSVALTWPLAAATGQMVHPAGWGAPERAILAVGVLNAGAYSGYVWLIGRAGSVFASQLAYLVTGFGIVWSMLLLGERYPAPVWAAFALILLAIALVQPSAATDGGP